MAKRKASSMLKPGTKIEKLFAYLKREMVGSELLFMVEHARHLMTELSISKPEFVWNMLQSLEQKGIINRRRRSGGEKGIIVSFRNGTESPDKPPEARRRGKGKKSAPAVKSTDSPTIMDALDKLMTEISNLRADRKKISNKIREKQTFFNQLKSMLPRR